MSADVTESRAGPPADPHRECWDLLPWFINGRLDAEQRAAVESHLKECAECRDELAQQQELHAAISRDDRVTYLPAASFEGLWSRIEELEREMPPAPPAQAPIASASRRARARASRFSAVSRWLVAAVVVQAIGLALVSGILVSNKPAQDWPFRTVTSPATGDPNAPRYRVVFARDLTLEDMQDVLNDHGLAIVRGSGTSDVFTLVAPEASANPEPADILARLRNDSRVRFAELEPQAMPQ